MKILIRMVFLALLTIASCNFQSEVLKEEYYPNKNIKRKYMLNSEGLITGFDSIFGIDGTLSKVSKWKGGRLVDSIVKYGYNGNISTIGKIQGEELIFYREDGTKESEINLSKGLKNGLQTIYAVDGKVVGFKGFKNNIEDGFFILLNKNYTPKYIKSDKGSHFLLSHYEDGLLKSFRVYDSLYDGYSLYFHPNGTLKKIGEVKNRKSDGLNFFFSDDGRLIRKSYFNNGNLAP